MAKEYAVAALWIGGNLSYLEQLCLKSFVDAGQHTILYTYEGVTNAPEGVEMRDANEILSSDNLLTNERTGSPALHSDVFRYHMLAKHDDLIWVDTDAYCVRRFETPNGHMHAWESKHGINGGVLGLPQDSETLAAVLEMTKDPYGIPEWYKGEERAEMEARMAAGNPVHAGEMRWGVWGPHALTHYLKKTGEVKYTLPQAALYPVPYSDRMSMTRPGFAADKYLTDETISIHLYGRRMRARLLEKFDGVARPRSLIGRLLKKHGIDPAAAPIKRKAPAAAVETAEAAPVKAAVKKAAVKKTAAKPASPKASATQKATTAKKPAATKKAATSKTVASRATKPKGAKS
ncbi:MAG: hypothetical protein Q4G24_05495 [Paracoccus sp. (in: a-proteobacteria)]|uniref:hypothetical protein n=1 Tax=Paracoccus sp. TaxID=267 RepID=UPI0026DEFBA6|nr:hypothetical protein [Paracoccus sp. (in: a-proteobacteria)]MDO5620907.1 hypothetical protein [Paracoccus sp. (in: a-proteobacteria)]